MPFWGLSTSSTCEELHPFAENEKKGEKLYLKNPSSHIRNSLVFTVLNSDRLVMIVAFYYGQVKGSKQSVPFILKTDDGLCKTY